MNHEIELISDGEGLAVIGDPAAVERFLKSEGLQSRDLGLARLGKVLGLGAAGAQAVASKAAAAGPADAGRWVKLTEESARKIDELGGLIPTGESGVSYAMLGKPGASTSWIKLEKGPGSLPTNPAVLANAPALMTQLAMQQAMDEITDYLAAIDAKLDEVLRAQKDAVLSRMIGLGLQIDEAMTIREHVGRVNEVTWSKVQDAAGTIADTQAYALLQLDALAEKLERKSTVAELLKDAQEAEARSAEWLAVLARCVQLQEGIAVLELDRVMETAPEDLESHAAGLKAARRDRLDTITRSTEKLLARMEAAAGTANSKVLFNPIQSPAVIQSSTRVSEAVGSFHETLGIGPSRRAVDARRWGAAVADVRDRARSRSADTLAAGRQLGSGARARTTSASGKLASRVADKTRRNRDTSES